MELIVYAIVGRSGNTGLSSVEANKGPDQPKANGRGHFQPTMNQPLTIQDYDKDPLLCWLLQEVRDELFNPKENADPVHADKLIPHDQRS